MDFFTWTKNSIFAKMKRNLWLHPRYIPTLIRKKSLDDFLKTFIILQKTFETSILKFTVSCYKNIEKQIKLRIANTSLKLLSLDETFAFCLIQMSFNTV